MTPAPAFSVIGGFFLRILLFLVPTLMLWYWGRDWVAAAPAWLAGKTLHMFFPHWVVTVEREGPAHVLVTLLRVAMPDGRVGELTPEVRALSYCYGSALLPALLLASRATRLWWKIPLGLVLLVPFQAWGLSFAWLLQIAFQSGTSVAAQAGISAFGANLIGVAYQFGYLLMPALAPILIWFALDRTMVATVLIEGALSGRQ
ncbi:hypothetical protein J5J83_06365 [Azoarcus sp. L1K30]|uniref:exosortase H-associated membrane protein n=1 Tax=Azoarcus sp. L1K30 TaxID=2820277 RepID=UPI001B832FD9|nr:exosortase H-associated membrane protein [Azoarcus sp. L1K30]MBR0565735.1 hypothetical protein [Azoarcus sp. L1K30]